MKSTEFARWVSLMVVAGALGACGGESSSEYEQRAQTLPEITDSGAAVDAEDEGVSDTVVSAGMLIESADVDATEQDSYAEEAKSIKVASGSSQRKVIVERDLTSAPTPLIVDLGTPSSEEQSILSTPLTVGSGEDTEKVARTGFGRRLPGASAESGSGAKSSSTASQLQWTTQASGWNVAAIGVKSGGAKALRVALRVNALPEGALLRYYAPGSSTMVQLKASEVASVLQAKSQDGTDAVGSSLFWGAITAGETSVIEIALPPTVKVGAVDVSIDQAIHMAVSPGEAASKLVSTYDGLDYSGSCQQDAVCVVGSAQSEGDAVVQLDMLSYDNFGVAGSYVCTGTLIGDNAGTSMPYVLTANHCVANQRTASDILAAAFFRSSTCNGAGLDVRATDFWGRWDYLYSETRAKGTDVSMVRVNLWEAVPTGTLLAGWDADYVKSAPVSSFHHPSGSLLKFSEGNASYSNTNFLKVLWSGPGTTEGGSSGSSILNAEGQVIGTLWGGASACSSTNPSVGNGLPDYYGRFSKAYARGLRRWLNVETYEIWASADLDGDGNRELIVRPTRTGGLNAHVYLAAEVNSSTGVIQSWTTLDTGLTMTDAAPVAQAVLDVDGDGGEDVVFRTKMADGTYGFRMLSLKEGVSSATTLWSGLHSKIRLIGMGLLDDDNLADMVFVDDSTSAKEMVTVLLRETPGIPGALWGARYPVPLDYKYFNIVGLGNFMGDGRAEIMLQHYKYKSSVLTFGWDAANGGWDLSNLMEGTMQSTAGKVVAVADVDGDGYSDLVKRYYSSMHYLVTMPSMDTVDYYRSDMVVPKRPSYGALVTAADLDADGKADLVWRQTNNGKIWFSRTTAGDGTNPGALEAFSLLENSMVP